MAVGWSAYVVHALRELGCTLDDKWVESPLVYNTNTEVRMPDTQTPVDAGVSLLACLCAVFPFPLATAVV